jgi:hypothetical protein
MGYSFSGRRFGAGIASLLAVPVLGALAVPASSAVAAVAASQAGPVALAGYTGNGFGTYYSYDSNGGEVTEGFYSNEYALDFIDLAGIGSGGDVQITTLGSPDYCVNEGWANDGSEDEWLYVSCYTPGGALDTTGTVDLDVTIARQLRKPSGVLDYSLVTTNASRTLTGDASYNSAGKANQVRHLGTGRYEVLFPGPASKGVTGTVEVTPYRTGGDCVDAGWTGTKSGQEVYVDCYSGSGSPQNGGFDVAYANKTNLLGAHGLATAAVEFPGTGWVMPLGPHYFSANARVAGLEWNPGDYTVDLAGTGGSIENNGGSVQVEAVSKHDDHCYTSSWDAEPLTELAVFCVNPAGNDVAVPFTLQWLLP